MRKGASVLEAVKDDAADDQRIDLGEKAYRVLYNEIIRCRILPGQDITEAQMCDRYDLSRSPVRRALALLAHDGLITPIPRSGFHVSDVSLATIHQTFEMRAPLEGLAARASVGRVDIDELRALNAEYVAGANAGKHSMLELHNLIHCRIYEATNNPILEKVLAQLLQLSNRIAYFIPKVGGRGYLGSDVVADEHEELFKVLENKDPEQADRIFRAHVLESEQRVIDALLKAPLFTDLPIRIGENTPARPA